MTVTIKNSKGSVVGTSESISITIKNVMETYQPADIVRDEQGNYINSKPVGEPIQLKGELLINFNLINPNVKLSKLTEDEEYTIEATKAYLYYPENYIETERLITLVKCKFNGKEGSSQGLYFTKDNLESVFKHYFPKLHIYRNFSDKVIGGFTKSDLDSPCVVVNKFTEVYQSLLHLGDSDSILLYESTDLNEFMQVTKQKLTDMFADWGSKVN